MESQEIAEFTLIDTDILIDASRNIVEAIACLDRIEQHSNPALSVITRMELVVGCRNKTELRKTERFLKRFQIIRLN
jgi:predicted nucleic acid-binding protein